MAQTPPACITHAENALQITTAEVTKSCFPRGVAMMRSASGIGGLATSGALAALGMTEGADLLVLETTTTV